MATQSKTFKSLDDIAMAALEQQVGLVSPLPQELLDRIFSVYKDFFSGYLNFLRQRERKPYDWIPQEVTVDAELVDEMRHFFSDYQHIVKRYGHVNRKLAELKKIDRVRQPQVYDLAVNAILEDCFDG
jgi:hypothetical protein